MTTSLLIRVTKIFYTFNFNLAHFKCEPLIHEMPSVEVFQRMAILFLDFVNYKEL